MHAQISQKCVPGFLKIKYVCEVAQISTSYKHIIICKSPVFRTLRDVALVLQNAGTTRRWHRLYIYLLSCTYLFKLSLWQVITHVLSPWGSGVTLLPLNNALRVF